MIAKKIIWCSNGFEICCADVIITDGQFEITCFLDNAGFEGCWLKEGQNIAEPLAPLNSISYEDCPYCSSKGAELKIYDHEIYEIKRISPPFEYHLTGKIINTPEGLISIGGIFINGFGFPTYCEKGKFVTAHYNRLDIIGP